VPAAHSLKELNMVILGWPNEPVLKGLPKLFDNARMSELLQSHWHDCNLPSNVRLQNLETRIIKYVLGDRCTFRHRLLLSNHNALTIYSKTHADAGTAERIFTTMRCLWNATIGNGHSFVIPEPLFWDSEINTVFISGLSGENADDHLEKLVFEQAGQDIGAAIAALHLSPIDNLSSRPDEYILSQVALTEDRLGAIAKGAQSRLAAITKSLREKSSRLMKIERRPIHGALRLSQLLMVEGKFGLVDFDDFSAGNPVIDIASLMAHWLHMQAKGKIAPAQSSTFRRQFCRSYEQHAPWGLPEDVLVWQTVAHLVGKQVKRCVKKPDKHYKTLEDLLSMTEAILNGKMSLKN
jgi:hypothetical protein